MTRKNLGVLFLFTILLTLFLDCQNNFREDDESFKSPKYSNQSDGNFIISGRVLDINSEPIGGATIVLRGSSGVFGTTADLSGDYEFIDIREGIYYIYCYKDGKYFYPQNMLNLLELSGDLKDFDFIGVDFYSDEKKYEINEVQGRAHLSPYVGKRVTNLTGVVLAERGKVGPYGNYKEIYIQNPNFDDDDRTSEGIKIFSENNFSVKRGDFILVKEGVVVEDKNNPTQYEEFWDGNLSRTQINTESKNIVILSSGNPSPKPILIGKNGRRIPEDIVCNDAVSGNLNSPETFFDPEEDAIDFYESLEGMFVEVREALVVGPYNEYDELYVVPDRGESVKTKTVRGGALLTGYDNYNPTIIKIIKLSGDIKLKGDKIDVGTIYNSPLTGIMDYTYGNYTIYTIESIFQAEPYVLSKVEKEVTDLEGDDKILTVAGFNLENFSAESIEIKINGIGDTIVNNLKCPDILGVVEVQDDSGDLGDGAVDCDATLKTITENIKSKTDNELFEYDYRYINPIYGKDGGAPGANIRVAFLYNKKRVSFIDRAGGEADIATTVSNENGGARISFSPGRIEPNDDAFISTRKSLVGEFEFNNEKVYVIVNHFSSKRGDYPIFGDIQPPICGSESKRHKQAKIINNFVKNILLIDPNANVVMVGDYNDYQFSKTLDILKGAELYNLIDFLPLDERYSYIHNGYCQTLDHILVSGGMLKRSPQIDVVRCFTEIGYAEKSVFSDHEPVTSSFIFGTTEPDTTPPEWIGDFPKITGVTDGSANLYAKINEKGFIYYILLYKESPEPSIAQLIAGKDGNNDLSLFSGKIKAYAKGLNIIPIKDIEPGTEYVLYTIAEDDETPSNLMTNIAALDFKTLNMGASVKNGSFEEIYEGLPVDWSVTGSGEFYVNSELGYDGNNCAYFETLTTSISGREIASKIFAFDKTKPFGASSYFYTPVETARTKVSLKIYFYSDSEGKILCGSSTATSRSLKEKDVWEKIGYDINSDKIPADAEYAKIALRVSYVKGVGTSSDRVYIDSVVLESDALESDD